MYYQRVGLFLALAICLFKAANAVKCYHCESSQIKGCGEKLEAGVRIADCSKIPRPRHIVGSKNSTSCVKMVREENGVVTSVTRGCFFENAMDTKSKCMMDPNLQITYKSCHICETDLCNGASTYGPITAVILLTTFIGHALML